MQREATIRWITIRLQGTITVLVGLNSNLSYIILHLQVLLQVLLFYLHMVTPALPKIHNAKAEEHEILGSR